MDTSRVDVVANIALWDLYETDIAVAHENAPGYDGRGRVIEDEG